MGGGGIVAAGLATGRPDDFQKSWIKKGLRANPAGFRIVAVEGDSMTPTLNDDDIVLVETGRRPPSPPGIFVLHCGRGLVARQLEHIPGIDPQSVKIVSDKDRHTPCGRLVDETNTAGWIRWFAQGV